MLRNHAKQVLEKIAADLAVAKSVALAVPGAPRIEKSAASVHGSSRVECGFSLNATVSEYLELRARVTRAWKGALCGKRASRTSVDDFIRFNEAIDRATSESIASHYLEKEQHARVFDASPDALVVVNASGEIVLANRQMEKAFGYTRQELLGKAIECLVPERLRRAHLEQRRRYLEAPHQRPMGAGLALFGQRKDGSEFPLDILLAPIGAQDGSQVLAAARDLTERNAVLAALYEARERSRVTLESIGDAVLSTDTEGKIQYLNKVASHMTGWPSDEARGQLLGQVLNIVEADQRKAVQLLPVVGKEEAVGAARQSILVRRDGSEMPIEFTVAPIQDANGKTIGVVIVFRDSSGVRELTRQMAYLAQHDFLTNLPNRMLLTDRLTQAIAFSERSHTRLAVLFLDLDRFKHINDSLGHGIGDSLLKSVAQRLEASVRASDTVSRIGGDEFLVLLSEVEQANDAGIIAEKLIAVLAEAHRIAGHDLQVSMSIGISVYPDDGRDAETLIKNADLAMYHAKDSGRNNAQFFTPDMTVRSVERQTVESELRRALDHGEFELYYQPKINLSTGVTIGAEALIRWHHPRRGLISPAQFIPIAEDAGLIVPIGHWVMADACRQIQSWHAHGVRLVPISVNVSAPEFRHHHFLAKLQAILLASHIAPRYLELELTESVLMQHAEASICVLSELKHIGVRLIIDDFGTGYSSLSYLSHFPIDALKIDQSFLREITTHAYNATIVSAMIGMCEGLRCDIIAEGVENAEQAGFLLAHNCTQAQGYYCGRPMPADDFAHQIDSLLSPVP
ncbi:MAG: EAL domain-containing protein [Pseudomonadota bacterium]